MTITVEIPEAVEKKFNENIARGDTLAARQLLLDTLVPTVEAHITNNTAQPELPELSYEEFQRLAKLLRDTFNKHIDPHCPQLSDYALSREGIYEGHPKI